MKVLEKLNTYFKASFVVYNSGNIKMNIETALADLKSIYGIKSKVYFKEGIVVLNYDQIECPKGKGNSVVRECRSLVLYLPTIESPEFTVCSRSFDRFFNVGEVQCDIREADIVNCEAHEKMDGSLVTLYYVEGIGWSWRTKSQAFSEAQINDMGLTFKDLIDQATPEALHNELTMGLPREFSYIFEITSPLNRVVVTYDKPELTLLAIRSIYTGKYLSRDLVDEEAKVFGVNRPKRFTFDTLEALSDAVKGLPNLEEGYVMYKDNKPVAKCKNPAYVAAHHMKGEGLNPKRICQLVINNELDEYYSVFPEDKEYIEPYAKAFRKLREVCNRDTQFYKGIESQKTFAEAVKDYHWKSLLFTMRKGLTFEEAFDKLTEKYKIELIKQTKGCML